MSNRISKDGGVCAWGGGAGNCASTVPTLMYLLQATRAMYRLADISRAGGAKEQLVGEAEIIRYYDQSGSGGEHGSHTKWERFHCAVV